MSHDHSRCGPSYYVENGTRYCLADQPLHKAKLSERLRERWINIKRRRTWKRLAHTLTDHQQTPEGVGAHL